MFMISMSSTSKKLHQNLAIELLDFSTLSNALSMKEENSAPNWRSAEMACNCSCELVDGFLSTSSLTFSSDDYSSPLLNA